jgi:hypothetical protein
MMQSNPRRDKSPIFWPGGNVHAEPVEKLQTGRDRMDRRRRGIIFYRVILPGFTLVNLGLGIFTLVQLHPIGPLGAMELATGAFCCAIAGWLAGAGWSKSYWGSAMERQVTAWRRIVDAMFRWIEDAPVPAESLRTLKRSLDETLTTK